MNRNLFKKRKPGPNVPPLGWKDICLYLLGTLVSASLCAGVFLMHLKYWGPVTALIDPEAVCIAPNYILVFCAAALPGALSAIALERWEHRYPIFGNPGFHYGGEDWDPVYPAMLRDENAPPEVRAAAQKARSRMVLWLLGLAASVVLCLLSVVVGSRLYADGSIRTIAGPGTVSAGYSVEEIDCVTVEVTYSTGRYRNGKPRRPELVLHIQTADDKSMDFRLSSFQIGEGESEIDALRRMLACCPDEKLRFENGEYLYLFREIGKYDDREMAYLTELFGAA